MLSSMLLPLLIRLDVVIRPYLPAAGGADDIKKYFGNLFKNGIVPVSYSIAVFLFGWAALELMFPNEKTQDRGKAALYRAVAGLALVLMATAIATIFQDAAK